MRIIGGSAAGLTLQAPKGLEVRPTPDLVRQAIFNSLGGTPLGARVLELFAGTGALSLECLSRGARSALCVEKSPKHAEYIRRNASATGLAPALQVRVQDAFAVLAPLRDSGHLFELILADPPYGEKNVGRRSNSFAQRLLDDPLLPFLAAPSAVFILGHTKRDQLTLTPAWREVKLMRHGDTVMRFFSRADAIPI